MAIIGLMTSIVIINYSSGQKTKDLEEQAVLAFVSDLRRAQSMAMSVYDCGGIQDKYGLIIIPPNKYRATCDTQDTELPVDITGSNIFFLPLSETRTTMTVENPQTFTIGTKSISISSEGKITY